MRFAALALLGFVVAGCQPSLGTSGSAEGRPPVVAELPSLTIDTSTPEKALKSYWEAKDGLRRAYETIRAARVSEEEALAARIGFDPRKFMTGERLANQLHKKPSVFTEYGREILEVKQDTDSRVTFIVRVRNITPAPEGAVVTDSDMKRREEGEKLRYLLEKEDGAWKVSQVFEYDEFVQRYEGREPWRKVFAPPAVDKKVEVYVISYMN